MKYTIDQIKAVLARKGYKFFDSGSYNLNIIGVRMNKLKPDAFDDEIYFIYRDEHARINVNCFPITTEAGLDCLTTPVSSKGTAILVPAQYSGMWELGLHKGVYPALVQVRPVNVYRDNNRDDKFDFDPKTIESGCFGINMHHASQFDPSVRVGKWSAGCQVFSSIKDFNFAMSLVNQAVKLYANYFTYTLIEEKDF